MTRLPIKQIFVASTLCVMTVAVVADEPENIIKYRKSVMESVGGHMNASALIVAGKASFSGDLPEHTQALANALSKVTTLFPEGSDFGDTRALDAIWSRPDEFRAAAKRAGDAAAELARVVKAGDKGAYAGKLDDLGEACLGCHKKFRRKNDE